MRHFELHIDDDRQEAPAVIFAQMADEARVRAFAEQRLAKEGWRGVEVRENGVRLFGLGALADPPDAATERTGG